MTHLVLHTILQMPFYSTGSSRKVQYTHVSILALLETLQAGKLSPYHHTA